MRPEGEVSHPAVCAQRHEGDDIGGAQPRVDTGVCPQIDEVDGGGDDPVGRTLDRFEWSPQGQNRSVVLPIGVNIEHRLCAGSTECADDRRVPAFADVDDALGQHPPIGHVSRGTGVQTETSRPIRRLRSIRRRSRSDLPPQTP